MSIGADQLPALIEELGFVVVGPNKALGQPRGVPTTLAVLSTDPPALMFGFRIHPEGNETQPVAALLQDVENDRAAVSFENGLAWLTLYDLSGLSISVVRLLVDNFPDTISATDLAVVAGCLHCGRLADAQLMCLEGHPTRLCPDCLAESARQRQELEAHLNRPSIAATVGLPAVGAYIACGWAVLWTLIDLVLEHWAIRVIEINHFTGALMLLLLAGVGFCLGWPMGAALRQSIAFRRAPKTMSVIVVSAAVICGEIGYLALRLLRLAGIFDLKFAAAILGQVLVNYGGFWITMKLACLGAISAFSAAAALSRKTASLDV